MKSNVNDIEHFNGYTPFLISDLDPLLPSCFGPFQILVKQFHLLHHHSNIFYLFVTGNEQGFFSIDPATGKLFAIKEIDRETLDSDEFILELEALQRDNTLKGGTARVKINIEDINDNRPQFEVSEFQKSILEGVPNGEEILKFEAYDKDIVRSYFNLLDR